MQDPPRNKKMIGLLGAKFSSGNKGVSALAESSIKCILSRWPDAEIILLGPSPDNELNQVDKRGNALVSQCFHMFPSKNIFIKNNLYQLAFIGLISGFLPNIFKKWMMSYNKFAKQLFQINLVVDITGGDSFTDMYGLGYYWRLFSYKYLLVLYQKKLVFFPQTYGPFKRELTRRSTKYVLDKASRIYSRDRESIALVKTLMGKKFNPGKVKFAPDVAFILDSQKPHELDEIEAIKERKQSLIVGLNISGLLYKSHDKNLERFGINIDYREMIQKLIPSLLENEEMTIVLVPHVVTGPGTIENDQDVVDEIYQGIPSDIANHLIPLRKTYNHREIKYVIGHCNFFLGSRMHSCIAALSQCIPAVGLAYSKKFSGVYDSIDVEELVVDLRSTDLNTINSRASSLLKDREKFTKRLKQTIPQKKQELLQLCDGLSC